jgi:hypothetical protein
MAYTETGYHLALPLTAFAGFGKMPKVLIWKHDGG